MKKIITKLPALLAILVATACSNGIKTYDGLYIVGTQGKEVYHTSQSTMCLRLSL